MLSAGFTWFMHFSCVERGQKNGEGERERERGRAGAREVERRPWPEF